MKKGLLSSTALVAATVLTAGVAAAAEAPTYKVNGNMQFMLLNESQDLMFGATSTKTTTSSSVVTSIKQTGGPDHGYYFAVVDPEIKFTMSGTADNGLNYGFKVEMNANTTDTMPVDEAVVQLSGSWGKLELGDEDGAEDTMQLGGESVMGGSGGIDGSYGLVLASAGFGGFSVPFVRTGPALVGDTSDSTKITYYTPNFSGLSAGVSFTPTQKDGDNVAGSGAWEDSIGLGVKYSGEFGGVSIAASGVYVTAAATPLIFGFVTTEDVSSWSVGGTVGFGPAVVGASYTDNGESLQPIGSGITDSYWNVGVGYTAGPIYVSAGYAAYTMENGAQEATRDVISLTADYSVAPGLTAYGEVVMSSEDVDVISPLLSNDATIIILGASLSF